MARSTMGTRSQNFDLAFYRGDIRPKIGQDFLYIEYFHATRFYEHLEVAVNWRVARPRYRTARPNPIATML